MKLIAENLSKSFNSHHVFRWLSFEIESGQSLAITGPNGSGKTTLIRILCGLIRPSNGSLSYLNSSGEEIPEEKRFDYIGLIGPYLELYQDLTALENLLFFSKMKGIKNAAPRIKELVQQFNLDGREDDLVKEYSSGMKQRLKYIFALLSKPEILFVDEPRSNLDEEGIKTVYSVLDRQRGNKILIIATNDASDLKFADRIIEINA